MNTYDKFEAVNDDYLKFDRVKNKRSGRPDLHAFMLLDELFPKAGSDMIVSAGHDEIWLSIEAGQTVTLTDEQIPELVRCGVRLDSEDDSLCMFA